VQQQLNCDTGPEPDLQDFVVLLNIEQFDNLLCGVPVHASHDHSAPVVRGRPWDGRTWRIGSVPGQGMGLISDETAKAERLRLIAHMIASHNCQRTTSTHARPESA
jgi:hypothetical protein